MAVIQSGASATQWTIDTGSLAGRTTLYDINGNAMCDVSSLNNILNALNANVTITLGGQSTVGFNIASTSGTLTLSFEATIDNANWFAISATPVAGGVTVTSATGNGQWLADTGGFYAVRARISSFTSGSMTVSLLVSPSPSKNIAQNVTTTGTITVSGTVTANSDGYATTSAPSYGNNTFQPLSLTTAGALRVDGSAVTQPVSISATVSVSGTVTSNQGTAAGLGGAWPVEVTDGSNILGTSGHPIRIDPTGVTTQPVSISSAVTVQGTVTANADGYATTSAPSYSNNTFNALSLTTAGALRVDGSAVTQPISGSVNQGTANTLSNKWPVQVTDGTNTMPTGDAVGRAIFEKITDGTNTAAVKAASTAAATTDPSLVVALSPNTTPFQFGGDDRLRVGQETFLFFDNIDGTSVNTNLWTQSQSGMTQSQTGGNLTLNAASSLTSGNYSILSSNKQMYIIVEYPLYCQFRAKLVPQTNAVLELGFGNAATTATPSDGCFFRVDTSGNVKGVINFGTAETTTSNLFSISSTTFYNWEVTIFEDHVTFEVQSADGVTNVDVDLPIPSTQGSPVSVGHLPVYARVYNNTATSSAAQMVIASVNAQQMDLLTSKPWSEQMAGAGRNSMFDPSALAQSANYTNNTAPASATLSNTAAGYTTLGGAWKFAAVAGAETDYALFAYQVPSGFSLYVTDISINSYVTGAASSTSATLLQWAVATNSSAVSLATGSPNPPIFMPIGVQTAAKTSGIGDIFDPGLISYSFRTPLVITSGKFFHVVLRIPVSNATASQIIRGNVMIEGYFE